MYPSSMLAYDRSADCQSESLTLHVQRRGRLLADEGLEDALAVRERDTRPAVLDRQHQLLVVSDFRRNVDRSTGR
jgi:hypothetical protein